jgi:hypothetical protein
VTLPALGRVDFAVLGILVGRRHLGLLQVDVLDLDGQTVLAVRARAVIAVEEHLGANVGQAVGEQAGLAVGAEQPIEGLDMGVHGLLKGGIGGVVLGGVAEQALAAEGVELVVPVGFGSRRGHGGGFEGGGSR